VTLVLGLAPTSDAQTPPLTLAPYLSGLSSPVLLTTAKDGTDRRYIVEQTGRIQMVQPGSAATTLFLDLTSRVLYGGERGLLGLAFHPQYFVNGRFYVNYTRRPDGATVVAEYRDGTEQRVLFTVRQPFENHNGGMIAFGPDGYLYIGMGDGGAGNDPQNYAQNPNELLGKMLRINVDLANSAPEIFASGLRNPWRFSFDRVTGQLYAGDVGQNAREEIDIVVPGGNYGWRVWEGTRCTGLGPVPCSTPGFIPPVAEYVNTGGNGRCSVTGGYVYRGTQASLPYGAYVYGDFCSGEIFMLHDGVQTVLLDTPLLISSFGEDEAGEIYVLSLNGSISRLTNPGAVNAAERPYATGDATAFVASTAGSGGAVTVGYGRIQADAGRPLPSGLAVFGFRQNGVLVTEASVPASRVIVSGRVFAETDANVNTGIALANPSDEAATVAFYFTDAGGTDFGSGTAIIPPRQQLAAFLNEPPFNGRNPMSGTFSFSSSVAIAAIALRGFTNERGEFLITTLPVAEPGTTQPAGTTVAHFASGGGWTTQLLLVNPSDAAISGSAQFINQTGQTVQTTAYSIAPRSSARIVAAASTSGMQVGSVRLAEPVAAGSVFAFNTNGVTVTQAGAPTLASGTGLRIYVEKGSTIRSGIAIANPSAAPVEVTLEVSGLAATLSIAGNGQAAMFLNEIPALAGLPATFQGILRLSSSTPVVAMGLRGRTNERGEFLITTTAPVDETVPANASEMFFPHFADGGNYSMQFIVFGRASSGTMYFFDKSGNPASLLFR
jgi:hypothetical protein